MKKVLVSVAQIEYITIAIGTKAKKKKKMDVSKPISY